MKIVIPDFIDLTSDMKAKIIALGDVVIHEDIVNDEAQIINRIKYAEIITANYINITAKIIESSPNLKYIIVPAVAYDWVDAEAAKKRNIKIINCPTYNSQAVAEHALGLMLAVSRRLIEAHNSISEGLWTPKKLQGNEVCNKNLLVVGHGKIGGRVLSLGQSIGMNCQYVDSKSTDDELNHRISEADYIVLALPLNEKTKGMFGENKIRLMKKTAILINVARGLIVDNDFLIKALEDQLIAGAGLDVFPDDNTIKEPTQLITRYAKLPNVVLTPHIGYNTKDSMLRLGEELYNNIKACIDGNPINVVV